MSAFFFLSVPQSKPAKKQQNLGYIFSSITSVDSASPSYSNPHLPTEAARSGKAMKRVLGIQSCHISPMLWFGGQIMRHASCILSVTLSKLETEATSRDDCREKSPFIFSPSPLALPNQINERSSLHFGSSSVILYHRRPVLFFRQRGDPKKGLVVFFSSNRVAVKIKPASKPILP